MRKPYVHAKIVLVDGQTAFAGSENVSSQSLDGNRELGVFLSQPAALSRMMAVFEQDWASHS
jgi:cardiolipin synthase A/B